MPPSTSPFQKTLQHFGGVKSALSAADDPASSASINVFMTTVASGEAGEPALREPESSAFEKLPTIGDVVGAHYQLTRLLGQGAFGTVFAAQRIDVPEHQVALKLLPRALLHGRNVERELVMLATVGHPHVVQLKDHGAEASFVWLTMPVYVGETLADRLERGPLSLREAHEIFLPIARGLEALHAAGLRHQDIKPENIFLAVFGGRIHPVLLDLGAAAEREATFVAGTLVYAAPEQVMALASMSGGAQLSEKMDTYGLGATMLTALVGPSRYPGMDAMTINAVSIAHDERAEKPLSDDALPELEGRPRELLVEAFKRWLNKEPEARPTMKQLADDLDVLLEKEREEARQEAARRSRQDALMVRLRAALALIAVAVLGAAWYGYSKRETLRLAGELEAAKREGAERFDKLDTCVASHAIEKSAAATCRSEREKDGAECKATIDALVSKDSSAHAKAIQDLERLYSARLRACEDAGTAATKACSDERTKQERERSEERERLTSERDKLQKLSDERGATLDTMKAQADKCEASRVACQAELDPYVAAAAAAASAAAHRPPDAPAGATSGGQASAGPPSAGAPTASGTPPSSIDTSSPAPKPVNTAPSVPATTTTAASEPTTAPPPPPPPPPASPDKGAPNAP